MIHQGPFTECIKTGVFFSVDNDDRLFVGDLFFDFVKKEFQVRGIPSFNGKRTHAVPVAERGPFKIHMLVKNVLEEASRPDGKYSDLRFKNAVACSSFLTWLEEWYGDRSVMQAVEDLWKFEPQLVWVKP